MYAKEVEYAYKLINEKTNINVVIDIDTKVLKMHLFVKIARKRNVKYYI